MVVGLRRFTIVLCVVAIGALAALSCADELVRLVAPRAIEAPLHLPVRAEIRVSDGLVRLLGVGATGGALAVTVGHTIVVSSNYLALPPARQLRSMRHERVHVQQRERLGRRYLLVYLAQFVRYGYDRHPLEREARHRSRARTASPLGRQIRLGLESQHAFSVIGIAPDPQYEEFGEEADQDRLQFHVPFA